MTRRSYGFWVWANLTTGALAASVLGVAFALIDNTYELLWAIPIFVVLALCRPAGWRDKMMDLFS